MLHSEQSTAARRLSDLRRAQPGDSTLQNLLGVLSAKLELCARLPIYEYEADREGHGRSVEGFRRLADLERESFNEVLACLRAHLGDAALPDAAAKDRRS